MALCDIDIENVIRWSRERMQTYASGGEPTISYARFEGGVRCVVFPIEKAHSHLRTDPVVVQLAGTERAKSVRASILRWEAFQRGMQHGDGLLTAAMEMTHLFPADAKLVFGLCTEDEGELAIRDCADLLRMSPFWYRELRTRELFAARLREIRERVQEVRARLNLSPNSVPSEGDMADLLTLGHLHLAIGDSDTELRVAEQMYYYSAVLHPLGVRVVRGDPLPVQAMIARSDNGMDRIAAEGMYCLAVLYLRDPSRPDGAIPTPINLLRAATFLSPKRLDLLALARMEAFWHGDWGTLRDLTSDVIMPLLTHGVAMGDDPTMLQRELTMWGKHYTPPALPVPFTFCVCVVCLKVQGCERFACEHCVRKAMPSDSSGILTVLPHAVGAFCSSTCRTLGLLKHLKHAHPKRVCAGCAATIAKDGRRVVKCYRCAAESKSPEYWCSVACWNAHRGSHMARHHALRPV